MKMEKRSTKKSSFLVKWKLPHTHLERTIFLRNLTTTFDDYTMQQTFVLGDLEEQAASKRILSPASLQSLQQQTNSHDSGSGSVDSRSSCGSPSVPLQTSNETASVCTVCGKRPRCRGVYYNRFMPHRIEAFAIALFSIHLIYNALS